LSGWRPSASAQAAAGISHQVYDTTSGNLKPLDAGVTLSQPLYRGGRTVAATRQAEENVSQERAKLVAKEQEVLLDAATAYLNLLRDQAILDLQTENEKTLSDWVVQVKERFRLGEKSKTDISLFESRLARAHADRATALINLGVTRSTYFRLLGRAAGQLEQPDIKVSFPDTREGVIVEAVKHAPEVLAAWHDMQAQEATISATRGVLLPELSIEGSANATRNENVPQQFIHDNRTENDRLMLQLKVPLYSGGGDYARLRAAYHERSEKRMNLDETTREAVEKTVQAWEQYVALGEIIEVRKNEIDAAQGTLQGMKIEERVGDRSSMDTLDAEQDLLNAQISEVQAAHDHTLALFHLAASIGRFTAERLNLNVALYDPEAHYKDSRGRWFGVGDAGKN
jgi:TolC family type I secretion outer membrane protein